MSDLYASNLHLKLSSFSLRIAGQLPWPVYCESFFPLFSRFVPRIIYGRSIPCFIDHFLKVLSERLTQITIVTLHGIPHHGSMTMASRFERINEYQQRRRAKIRCSQKSTSRHSTSSSEDTTSARRWQLPLYSCHIDVLDLLP